MSVDSRPTNCHKSGFLPWVYYLRLPLESTLGLLLVSRWPWLGLFLSSAEWLFRFLCGLGQLLRTHVWFSVLVCPWFVVLLWIPQVNILDLPLPLPAVFLCAWVRVHTSTNVTQTCHCHYEKVLTQKNNRLHDISILVVQKSIPAVLITNKPICLKMY
jgi:hypothetical protein